MTCRNEMAAGGPETLGSGLRVGHGASCRPNLSSRRLEHAFNVCTSTQVWLPAECSCFASPCKARGVNGKS